MSEQKDWKQLAIDLGLKNEALQAKNDVLVARVARLKSAIAEVSEFASDKPATDTLIKILNILDKADNETDSELLAEIQAEAIEPIAKAIHYPDCWDTMAYPTLLDAISEMAHCNECQQGKDRD